MNRLRWLGTLPLAGVLALLVVGPNLSTAQAPLPVSAAAPDSCVSCHTSRTALEPLVRPLPPPPAEGEG